MYQETNRVDGLVKACKAGLIDSDTLHALIVAIQSFPMTSDNVRDYGTVATGIICDMKCDLIK